METGKLNSQEHSGDFGVDAHLLDPTPLLLLMSLIHI